jgi:hypothetical protein
MHRKKHEALGNENNEGLGFAPDWDEIVHSFYAILKNVGHGHVMQDMQTQVNLAHQHSPWPSLSYDPVAHNWHGFAGVLAGNLITMPFAGLAMKAGWGEWREAKPKNALIDKHLEELEKELKHSGVIVKATHGRMNQVAAALLAASQLRIKRMKDAKKASKLAGKIGKYSFLSGSAIMTRCVVELGRNGVIFLAAPGAAVGGAAILDAKKSGKGGFTTATGLISNVLAPVAAIFALMLGVHFLNKTRINRNAWSEDLKKVSHEMKAVENTHPKYHNFVIKKMKHRQSFFKSFTAKNRFFVAGAALYTIGSLVPVVVKMLAAFGITSKKILNRKMLLAMFVAAVGGAAIMGLFSAQFFFGHPKQERYDGYSLRSTPELDRRFLSSIDTFQFMKPNGERETKLETHARGVDMRNSVYKMIKAREKFHHEILQRIAVDQKRVLPQISHVEDDDYKQSSSYRIKSKIFTFPLRLRAKDVEAWADTPAHYNHILQFFRSSIASQTTLLEKKTQVQERMQKDIDDATGTEHVGARQMLDLLSGSHEQTIERLKELEELREALSDDTQTAWSNRETLMKKVLEAQGTDEIKYTEKEPLGHHLGEFFKETMTAEIAADRGTLIEAERDAGSMRRAVVWK